MTDRKSPPIHGLDLDEAGRCRHYHTALDIAALKCSRCGKYYACYQCHDSLEDHPFQPTGEDEPWPVLCGVCRHKLRYEEYESGRCPYCGSPFNPGCRKHHSIYFACRD